MTVTYMTPAHAIPGEENIVHSEICTVADHAKKQSGCIEYRVLQSAVDKLTTISYEVWVSDDARNKFLSGSEVKMFAQAVDGRFSSPPQPIGYIEL